MNMDKVETRISRLLQLLQVPLPSILALPVIILVLASTSRTVVHGVTALSSCWPPPDQSTFSPNINRSTASLFFSVAFST